MKKNNGFINQYLGDGIMALFPESPLNALRAAVQMQEEIQEYNKQRVQKGQESIVVGMGLHSGSLIMGITGDEYRLDATTISDVVNSASRIENLSKHYGSSILLSESSLKEIGDTEEFNFRYFGPVQVKGKQNALNIYECINGDTPQQKKLKFATLPEFEKAIKHYFGQSFSEALEIMKSILQQNPADKAANLFLSKSERYLKTGVAKDWTGLEEIGKK